MGPFVCVFAPTAIPPKKAPTAKLRHRANGEASGALPEMLFRFADLETASIDHFHEQVAQWLPRIIYAMVAADNLNPQKARILLMLALSQTSDIGDIRRMFTVY